MEHHVGPALIAGDMLETKLSPVGTRDMPQFDISEGIGAFVERIWSNL